jgi:hypothetical protein
LHTVPSSHEIPFGRSVCWQPLAGLQESMVHGFVSSQSGSVPPVQMPEMHVSTPLQAFPSEHEVPFPSTVFWHAPPTQASAVHGFASLQSPLPLHGWQPRIGAWVHPLTGLQASVVQALPSSQSSGVPAAHTPLWQVSVPLQTVVSAHDVPFATGGF